MTEKKTTFVDRVLKFINGGELANIKAIQKTATKMWKKDIEQKELNIETIQRTAKYEISENEEYLSDAKISLTEAYLNIDGDIKGKTNVDAYISQSYENQIAYAKSVIDHHKKAIDNINSDVDMAVNRLKKEISYLKEDIKAIS